MLGSDIDATPQNKFAKLRNAVSAVLIPLLLPRFIARSSGVYATQHTIVALVCLCVLGAPFAGPNRRSRRPLSMLHLKPDPTYSWKVEKTTVIPAAAATLCWISIAKLANSARWTVFGNTG